MRKIFICIIVLCLFMSGCGLHNTALDPQGEPGAQFIDNISLGITPQQLLEHLSRINFEVDMPDYEEFPLPEEIADAVPDGRIYNMTDLSFYYKIKDYDLYFTFGNEGYLVSIHCQDEKISTSKGLVVGDSLDKAKALYGSDFEQNDEGFTVLQYKNNDGYLNVFYSENVITHWSFTKHPNINND